MIRIPAFCRRSQDRLVAKASRMAQEAAQRINRGTTDEAARVGFSTGSDGRVWEVEVSIRPLDLPEPPPHGYDHEFFPSPLRLQ